MRTDGQTRDLWYVRSLRGLCTKNRMCSSTFTVVQSILPIPVAVRSKAARLLGLRVRIPAGWGGEHGNLSVVSVVFCHVKVSATGRSLVQRSPTDCGVSECNREASTIMKPWLTKGCQAKKSVIYYNLARFRYWCTDCLKMAE